MTLPDYYSHLAPFEGIFLTGQPILTYHHVGPRRRGARLKGLYISPKLFRRQIGELKAAGFSTPPLINAASGGINPHRQVFLTFDDGFRDVFNHALPVLQAHGFRAVLFLVVDLIGKTNEWQQRAGDIVARLMDETQVRAWLAAGQEIGAHTCTHPRLTELAPDRAREEVTAGKKRLEDWFGVPVEHFCYPYGDWNGAVRDLVTGAGYRSACTTHAGVNVDVGSPLELKRFTARYPTRNLKTFWGRLRGG